MLGLSDTQHFHANIAVTPTLGLVYRKQTEDTVIP